VVDKKFQKNKNVKELKVSDIFARKFGLYRDLDDKIQHIVYVKYYDKGGCKEIQGMTRCREMNTVAVFARSLMYDGIDKEKFGILPSSIPFRGQVICVYPPLRKYGVEDMIIRAQLCLEHRYDYLNNHNIWPLKDKYSAQCGYKDKIIFPKKTAKLCQLYSQYQFKKDMYEPGGCAMIDEQYAIKYILEGGQRSDDKVSFFLNMMYHWKRNQIYFSDIWTKRGYTIRDVLKLLEYYDGRLVNPILKAMMFHECERDRVDKIYAWSSLVDKTDYTYRDSEKGGEIGEDFPDIK